eukprot:GHRQ01008475.1.p1 GENE.GHRQ01008475.1~~GHRQ01008475.1.p1  ORF type:complete len:264 (+),score=67.65 GHRQ01008475.1:365-1156(+)
MKYPAAPGDSSCGGEASVLLSPNSSSTHHRSLQHGLMSPPELRPPPARYTAHTSNLACLASVPAGKIISSRWPRGAVADQAACVQHLPRTSVLCRLMVAMIALLVLLQAVSCGMFFCVRLPFSPMSYVDYRDLISDLDMGSPEAAEVVPGTPASISSGSTGAASLSSLSWQQQQLNAPKLIPRVIHQTYRSTRLPASAKQFMHSWQERNGEAWQVRLYSDEACLNFVRREFPEYFEAYMNLPKEVERADFFRWVLGRRAGQPQ